MSKAKTALAILLTFIAIAGAGMSMALQGNTLTEWWRPAAVCLPAAVLLSLPVQKCIRRLMGWSSFAANYLASLVLTFPVLLAAVYSINYYLSDSASARVYDVPVSGKHSEERRRTRRAGRRYVASGEKYYVYYIDITLPDSTRKEIQVPVGSYVKMRSGATVKVTIEQGALGMKVIKELLQLGVRS